MNNVLKLDSFMFGGDYNPDQWLKSPEILERDIEMFKEAKVNVVSLGIFAWSTYEPLEGEFHLEWMKEIIDKLYENGIYTVLATPSGARPKWLADKYPEVLRVNKDRHRISFGMRHNHCHTSPVYRDKVYIINKMLAENFGNHPGVILWHVSNEYGGECYCQGCQKRFQQWLADRYGTIEKLNDEWVTAFWSHSYNSFDQIEAPGTMELGEWAMNPLLLNWRRFVTDITIDFMQAEIKALRDGGSDKPCTTNFMYDFDGLNYKKFKDVVEIVSWDNYSRWHRGSDIEVAYDTAFQHDLMRSIKHQPFMLMESCPTAVNWQKISKLRWPGLAETAGLQAIAHGSDTVMYFQMRQARAGMEKLHGALISSYGEKDDRIFQESKELGDRLDSLGANNGGAVPTEVAFIYDRENIWALEDSFGPRNKDMGIKSITNKCYKALRRCNLNVDILDMEEDLTGYKLVVAPLAYLHRAGFADKVRKFVENGGSFVTTYWFGIVDEDDKMHLGAVPHDLVDLLGLRETEIDALYDGTTYKLCKVAGKKETSAIINENVKSTAIQSAINSVTISDSTYSELKDEYEYDMLCNLIETTTAKTIMTYGSDFYAGTPAVTVNEFGQGKAYYLGAHAEDDFFSDIMKIIVKDTGLNPILEGAVPKCVEVSSRMMGDKESIFLQNYSSEKVAVDTTVYSGQLQAFETVVV